MLDGWKRRSTYLKQTGRKRKDEQLKGSDEWNVHLNSNMRFLHALLVCRGKECMLSDHDGGELTLQFRSSASVETTSIYMEER